VKLRPTKISALGDCDYEAVFEDSAANELTVRFHIEYGRGVALVQPDPDIFMDGRADTRAITALVMAFHRARGAAGSESSW